MDVRDLDEHRCPARQHDFVAPAQFKVSSIERK
jgi:hypothetical protein